ncbi:hypothetical protein AAFF_G00255660 [Aldrovandia affinis]|uniref:Uncharacterized protein n=1 Tax=Aldrovandia affinis TaxID=143900 RepID=A0AAD7RCK6_9TELE|nr:hypothetical protein AAFF_G00255660 [Aldrovandia affinis]
MYFSSGRDADSCATELALATGGTLCLALRTLPVAHCCLFLPDLSEVPRGAGSGLFWPGPAAQERHSIRVSAAARSQALDHSQARCGRLSSSDTE